MNDFDKENLSKTANVLRDGAIFSIAASELVCGDIIEIIAGDEIPADVRIIQAENFTVDICSLTGESGPQSRDGDIAGSETMLFEARNVAFANTPCIEAYAREIVLRCGDDTIVASCMRTAAQML